MRIEVIYTKCVRQGLVGHARWLDERSGKLYRHIDADFPIGTGYTVCGPDSWSRAGIFEVRRRFPQVPEQSYPDGNPKSVQGAKKHSLRYSPTAALVHMNGAFADGAAKYGAANWREKGVAGSVYIDAALRHIALYFDGGEQVASDSKVHHLGHAMACLAIILDAEAAGTLTDDRPAPMPNLEALLKRT